MTHEIDLLDVYDFLLNHEVDEPVTILKNGAPQAALIPYEIFLEIKKRYAPRALQARELSSDDIKAIMSAEIPEEHAQYNDELEAK